MLPQNFINRQRELEFLKRAYSGQKFNLVVIYGRRRVGKSELIKKSIIGKTSCYILCTNDSISENIKSFKERMGKLTGKDYFKDLAIDNFYGLFNHFKNAMGDNPAIIAIDEFPFLLELNKGLLSVFQKIIDELLIDTKITLLLSGSSMSIMENDVLGYKSPLYGRNLNIWKLNPFSFPTLFELFGDVERALNVYFIFGNIPYYVMFYNKKESLERNIENLILSKGINLYDEPLILLREEFRESRIYRLVLKYISLGYRSIGKLCSATGMDKSNISKYLDSLQETGFIRHILPLGMKRKGVYEIVDPFFSFWFRFIYPHRDDLELNNLEVVLDKVKNEKNQYFGRHFEFVIEELLKSKFFYDLDNFNSVHKWWHKDKEIDIVALNDETKEILFAECKWQDKVDAEKVLSELKEKSKYVEWNNETRKERFAVFAKSFKHKIFQKKKNFMLFDLKDIEKVFKKRK